MAKLLQKIFVVLWKHAVVRIRHKCATLFEILLPILIVLGLPAFYSEGQNKRDTAIYVSQDPAEVLSASLLRSYDTHIYYAPSTNFTNKLMNNVDDALQSIRQTIVGVKNEDDILHAFNRLKDDDSVMFIGIIFDDNKEEKLPKTLRYRVRSKKNLKIEDNFMADAPEGPSMESGQYVDTGIGALQLYIDHFFIDMVRKEAGVYNKDLNITWSVQKFPYPSWMTFSLFFIHNSFVFLMVWSFSMSFITVLKGLVSEKENGVKEFLKLNGLKTWMLWLCWLINTVFVNMISVIGIVLVLKLGVGNAPPVFKTSDVSILWAVLTMFCISSTFYIFAISSFFEKATLSVVVGSLLYMLPTVGISLVCNSAGITVNRLLCLLPQGCLFHGMHVLWQYELRGNGLQWNNVFVPPGGNPDQLTMADVFIMYFVGIIIFTLITCYMDAVKPGKYGIARPWYFLCTVCFPNSSSIGNLETQAKVTKKFEAPPENLKVGIRIKKLFKMYTSKVAVNGVTLDIYHGEITALLGHNGAGKTTIMSILSGMFSATSGSVMINDYDTKNDMDKIRENLGLCPQNTILIPELTVEEHLIFFGMLKGLSKKTANESSKDILNKLDFADKNDWLPSKLSGGMQRKLSLGIAMTGNAKVLILDEPTSGMDVEVRRQVWDLLLSMRGQKTILISTHYMEEADVLGDRVAIMDHGKVKCYGTTLFLKRLYGTGYNLSIIKLDGCNESAVWSTITKNVPEATIKNLNGPVMYFSLPLDQTSKFPKLFDSLETDKKTLRIGGVGVSLTTLEDVFLNVGKECEDEASEYGSIKSETIDESRRLVDTTDALTKSRLSGLKMIVGQFTALLMNNVLFTYRNSFTQLMKVLFALALTVQIILVSLKFFAADTDFSARVFSLNDYGKTEVFLHPGLCREDLIQFYKKEIESTNSALTIISNSTKLEEILLQEATSNIAKFREKMIVAAEFKCYNNSVMANAMYSNTAFHGFPISVNIMSNALLKFFSNESSIIFSYEPFKIKEPQGIAMEKILMLTVLWMLCIPLGVLYVVCNFIANPLLERVSKSKHIKFMAGVNPVTYWLAHFLWDLVCYSVIMIILLVPIIVFGHQGMFTKPDMTGVFFMLLILHGFATMPFIYVFSYLSETVSNASTLLIMFNLIVALLGSFAMYILDFFNKAVPWGVDDEINITDQMLHLIPLYTLASSMKKYATVTFIRIHCMMTKQPGCEKDMSYFSETSHKEMDLTQDVMFFGIDFLLYFSLLLLIEFGFVEKVYTLIENLIFRRKIVKYYDDDNDVKAEELAVKKQLQGIQSKSALLVYKLVKKYYNFPAVKGISFGVSEGECFGLLGTNGAGKTTTFQMLTGDVIPTCGKISVFGYKLSKNKHKYLSHIGYCPQFDALDEHLTGIEILSMYAKLRGVPDDLITAQINSWINLLGLNEYCKKVCGTYSGGNKRKLSAAVALIGNPPVVFLDEPTTGVDPVSRRKLWNVLGKIQKTGQAVVLTSHSMEECEALCTRLAIMVAGQFMCVGNSQYLKQKFGQGFTVMIKLKSSEIDPQEVVQVKLWFEEQRFPNICILKDEHVGLLHYQITDPNVTLKQLFTILEEMKKNFKVIEDYAVSETTLEQIFLSLARKKVDRIAPA